MDQSPITVTGYDLLRQLGSGGMSTVYLAVQKSLDRQVAIKIMRRAHDSASNEAQQFERRFLLEGRTLAKLPHRNIVAVYDIVSGESVSYIAMEYLPGGTLAERLQKGLSLADAVSIIVQIANALEFAHTHGIVHRDLKPANIMFRDGGTPVLTDFGIARQRDTLGATKLTQTGMLVGTPTYMSPEQINALDVDGRADLYSLGVLFYELLTGAPPFKGDSPIAVLMAHLTQAPPPLAEPFAAFQPVLDSMLAKSRDERYSGMGEFVAALKARVVESNTLFLRLQLDPEQNTSEQLRALGFAMSDPSSPGLRTPTPRVRAAVGTTPRPASGKRAAVPAERVAGRRVSDASPPPRWPWAVGAGVALLLALAALWQGIAPGGMSKDEQELVGFWLRESERLVAQQKFIAPPGDNAYELVGKVLQKDAANARAQEVLDSIAHALGDQAEAELKSGKVESAQEHADQALMVRKDDVALLALKNRVNDARRGAQAQEELKTLFTRVDQARSAGRVFGSDGAYALLQQARKLAPQDTQVGQRLSALIEAELAPAKKALDRGDADTVTAAIARLGPYLAEEPAYAVFKANADAVMKKEQLEKQLTVLLTRARDEVRGGRLNEPPGNNAYDSLQQLRQLAADDNRVLELADSLGRALLAEARKALEKNDTGGALQRIDLSLAVAPKLSDATALKTEVEKRLGQRQLDINRALSSARQALAEQRFLAPPGNNAKDFLGAALKLDPQSVEAKQLLAELPARLRDAATARAAQGDAAGAAELIASARREFAQDSSLEQLQQKLDAQIKGERAQSEQRQQRERIAKALRTPAPGAEALRASGKDLAALIAADPSSKENLELRKRLAEVLAAELHVATTVGEFDALAGLIKELGPVLQGEEAYTEVAAQAAGLRSKIGEQEQARSAAQRGELVLNAAPWAKVESVVDSNQKPVALPADTTTPLVLTLPAGSYAITFRHPQVSKPVQAIAKVEAQRRIVTNAAFPAISSKEYFSRAGW